MTRSWKFSLVFVSSLALGTFANAQLAVGAGARGQALGSLNGNAFAATGTLNADGTIHGGLNDGVRPVQPSTSVTASTAPKATRRVIHTTTSTDATANHNTSTTRREISQNRPPVSVNSSGPASASSSHHATDINSANATSTSANYGSHTASATTAANASVQHSGIDPHK